MQQHQSHLITLHQPQHKPILNLPSGHQRPKTKDHPADKQAIPLAFFSNFIESLKQVQNMNVYAISGLGADERAFQFLDLPFELIHIKWIEPQEEESLTSYASRLCRQIDHTKPFALVGLSFGGMLATEMCKFITPEHTILLSSAETKKGLPWWFRLIGNLKLTRMVPKGFMEGASSRCCMVLWN